MKERIAIIHGIRTPMAKSGKVLKHLQADDLGAIVVQEVLAGSGVRAKDVDEVIIGNVAQPTHAANVARVIALKAGVPESVPAVTVHRNCASGMESITTGAQRLLLGDAQVIVAGGVESMSNIPLLYNEDMTVFFSRLMRSKSILQQLKTMLSFRLRYLKPVIALMQGLTDPVCNLIMGMTAENLSKDFKITRQMQDEFALASHQKAAAAIEKGRLRDEIIPVPAAFDFMMMSDDGPRFKQTMADLQKLRPYFDRQFGTVTVGTSSQVTDGAAAVVLTTESYAKSNGFKPLGYLREYAYSGCEPERMGLGPVFATSQVLDKAGLSLQDIELIEMNEAFSAQVLANVKAFESLSFAQKHLGKDKALGSIDMDLLNVNGGAIALGHPLGMTGTRIVLTLLKEMRRRKMQMGLATLCVGGGQGGALILEVQ